MHRRMRGLGAAVLIVAIALGVAGCGGGGTSAQSLLRDTFTGQHPVNSGVLQVVLTLTPTGSSTLKAPVSLSFGGPFQSRGTGKLPASDFSVALAANGGGARLGIVSTGTAGYVTLDGTSYRLPAANFDKLESSFSAFTSSSSRSAKGGTLSSLGIDPLRWLEHPRVVGTDEVGGASTTHIHATVEVEALLGDLGTLLRKASSSASQVPSSISPATRARIASAIHAPSFDLWTGTADRTLRRMQIAFVVPVTGSISTLLGGLTEAAVTITFGYSDLNRPQTISAPANLQPYSGLSAKLRALVTGLESSVATGAAPSGTSGTATGATTGAPTGAGATTTAAATTGAATTGAATTSATTTGAATTSPTTGTSGIAGASGRYSRCMAAAGNDIAKMQKCSGLVGH